MDEKILIGKKIKTITVDGYGVNIVTEDGICLDYIASDGDSCWDIFDIEEEIYKDV